MSNEDDVALVLEQINKRSVEHKLFGYFVLLCEGQRREKERKIRKYVQPQRDRRGGALLTNPLLVLFRAFLPDDNDRLVQ